ncbi:polyhydroxyalkanoate depolymerase [Bosea sp. (in: a-proteobacteria)]|uniref:polyhydroxyalkanoate depolymerase n=1 Tax=Bosea sp. (in: a-proteobacteria) TaxID=1871050 RepID=UPI0008697508|nr:polyhydroxyalkanoate depolymerase [Bosea sp. (in: a-proteobacteria)]MBN9438365.1 polyhydroxyalkanoate depolymerase [Bosea sp. (in: a-proteobacteria)]MBN9448335.1 polyhydroxyalkanoate depolymerase [Bosea sp. (in: a-proteobacteria)]ODT44633.1 MAG: esterase [Methylobacterium sp. SCN 67-24]
MSFAYHAYEAVHMMVSPARAMSDAMHLAFKNPANPLTYTPFGRSVAASCELFERTTRRYGKPAFGLAETTVGGVRVAVEERVVWQRPFCNLVYFDRQIGQRRKPQPKVLMVAPMSGHYATLLRGTVEAFLPDHEVYITDWVDARLVPMAAGRFDLDDYIDYVIAMLQKLGPDTHVMAVCQPSVPVLAAIARMEAEGDPNAPRSMTLMGGPIDTRRSPTAVNDLAMERGTDWFRRNCITRVPFPHLGAFREVYPGFLQLSGFMAMNFDRHLTAHYDMYKHLVAGDGDSAEKHRDFYDEYLAVMDLTAEFYLETVDKVFVQHALPKGELMHRDKPVDLTAVRRVALMTVEGEKDDISGVGQTKAAHDLCVNIPDDLRAEYLQMGVGHYGVFNGSRFRSEIAPRISDFMLTLDMKAASERRNESAATARKALKVAG